MSELIREVKGLRGRIERFVNRYSKCIKTAPSREHMRSYISGQVGPMERKNVEAIALDAGIKPRTLQAFMEWLRWDEDAVASKNRDILRRDHFDENAIGVIDETSFMKKGNETVGVQRQYCGAAGKIANCVVSVNLAYVSGDFAALADTELYLPKETWCEDRYKREAAGIPEDIVFRTKLEIAIDLLKRTRSDGVPLKYLTADELYGRSSTFRHSVAEMELTYVVEIPCDITGWPASRLEKGKDACRVDELCKRGGPKWQMYHVKNTEKGPLVWEVRATRFSVCENKQPSEPQWLMIARNMVTKEEKYFLSNAQENMPVESLLHVAFKRWHVERLFQDAKGQIGMDHFEVRCYVALKRHMILSLTSLLFLMREVTRLRKKLLMEPSTGSFICGVTT